MLYVHDIVLSYPSIDVYSEKVVVVTCQEQQPIDIVTHDYSGEMTMFRCRDDNWTKIPNVEKSQKDICIIKGKPCGRQNRLDNNDQIRLERSFGG